MEPSLCLLWKRGEFNKNETLWGPGCRIIGPSQLDRASVSLCLVLISAVPCLRPHSIRNAGGPQTLQGAASGHNDFEENVDELM